MSVRRNRLPRALKFVIVTIIVTIIVAVSGVLGLVLGFSAQRGRSASFAAAYHGRFTQLEWALLDYYDDHGRFPPTHVDDAEGNRMHSWRVLLLPYLGTDEEKLAEKLDLSEPWDSPKNKSLGAEAPGFYRGLGHEDSDKSWTRYVAVTDAVAGWPRYKPLSAFRVTKDSSSFLLVELPASGIHWMEPVDRRAP